MHRSKHPQCPYPFGYLRCFKSDFDSGKGNVCELRLRPSPLCPILSVHTPIIVFVRPFVSLMCLRSYINVAAKNTLLVNEVCERSEHFLEESKQFCERSEQALRRSYQNLARSANFLLVILRIEISTGKQGIRD